MQEFSSSVKINSTLKAEADQEGGEGGSSPGQILNS